MSIEENHRGFTERRSPLKSAADANDPPARIDKPVLVEQMNPFQLWTTPSEPELVRRWRSRLVGRQLRNELRARPGLQGRVIAPAGTVRRLPRTPAPHFPLYHDVPQQYAAWMDIVQPILGSLGIPAPFFISTDAVSGGENPTWHACRNLIAGGLSCGSHTRSDRRLPDPDDEAAPHEIGDSKAAPGPALRAVITRVHE